MERKQTSTTVTHTQYGDLTTKTTRITQESRLDRSRRIASQNSTLFRFALSGTIVVLFFGLFLLIGTTDYYNSNAQELKWVDDNGQFIENSYNFQVSITNNTPLDNLNGLTLNEVFDDNNLIVNSDFSNGLTNWIVGSNVNATIIDERLNVIQTGAASSTSANHIQQQNVYTTSNYNDLIYIVSQVQSVSGTTTFRIAYPTINTTISTTTTQKTFISSLSIGGFGDVLYFGIQGPGEYNIDYIKVFNLTTLGIDLLTQQEMDNYYNLWLENQDKRSLEIYNNLGNIPVTNLENMNSVLFKPAVDIVNGMTDTATGALGFSLQAWNFVIDIWNRIWGG